MRYLTVKAEPFNIPDKILLIEKLSTNKIVAKTTNFVIIDIFLPGEEILVIEDIKIKLKHLTGKDYTETFKE